MAEQAIRGPRPEMFPHTEPNCNGQFHWDDSENCFQCIVCGEKRDFYEW